MTPLPGQGGTAEQAAGREQHRLLHILLAVCATMAFILLTGAYYLLPRDRSVLIEARTDEVMISARPDVVWAIPGAILCRDAPRSRQANATAAPPDGVCGAFLRIAEHMERVIWPRGSKFALRRAGLGAPTIEVLAPTGSTARRGSKTFELEAGDLIVLPASYAPLPARGHAVLGAASASGPPVRSGRFEWRETLPFRMRPSLIGSENLHAGDVVNVALGTCGSDERLIESLLILPFDRDTPGMTVVLSAADADRGSGDNMGLCLTRFGFDPTFIEPRIIDRIVSDPVIYGLGVFLTAALTVFPATLGVAEILALRRRRRDLQTFKQKKNGNADAHRQPPHIAQDDEIPGKRSRDPKDSLGEH